MNFTIHGTIKSNRITVDVTVTVTDIEIEVEFMGILQKNMQPEYDSAK